MSMSNVGVILWKNRRLLVLARITDEYVDNGFSLIKVKDIVSIASLQGDERLRTAVNKFGLRLKSLPASLAATESIREFVSRIPSNYPVAIHQEHLLPNECEVGFIICTTKRSLTMECLSINGESNGTQSIAFSDITKIDFLGRYETIVCSIRQTLQK